MHIDGFQGRVESVAVDKGGAICDVRTDRGWQVGIVDTTTPDSFPAPPLFSTNQFYVRVSAIRRVLALDGDTVDAVRRFVDRQPFFAERKVVTTDAGTFDAVQLSQGLKDVFRHMRLTPVLRSRFGVQGARGGYAGLKRADDVTFGQLLLDTLNTTGNDLALDHL